MTLAVFNQETKIVTRQLTSGAVTSRLMSAAEFKRTHGLKGQEGKRRYNDYARSQGLLANQNVAAQLAGGKIVIVGSTMNKVGNGGTLRWVAPARFEDKPVVAKDLKSQVKTMSDEERAELMALLCQDQTGETKAAA